MGISIKLLDDFAVHARGCNRKRKAGELIALLAHHEIGLNVLPAADFVFNVVYLAILRRNGFLFKILFNRFLGLFTKHHDAG